VEITRPFFLGTSPVTQHEYEQVMGTNPSYFSKTGLGKDHINAMDTARFPVESVSWEDAYDFCVTLSRVFEELASGFTYRLPTEAEWEFACRAGAFSSTHFHFGDSLSRAEANFKRPFPQKGLCVIGTAPVGSYPANAFGLLDMHGNVWEWCLDWYDENYYKHTPTSDPHGPDAGARRVVRGGGWNESANACSSPMRIGDYPDHGDIDTGFRVCCSQAF
jgi:formylglycine-generating enzyme required for sulfatase activity